MKTIHRRNAVAVYLAGLVVIHIAVFWNLRHLVDKGYSDFTIYYSAGRIVRQGLGHQLYDLQTQFRIQQEFAKEVSIRQGPLPFNHPPFEALLFSPLTRFSYPVAFALWDLANLAMLAALPFLLRPLLPRLQGFSWSFWMLAMFAFFPIFFTFLQGQDAILLLFLYSVAFVCLKKNRDAGAGCWLGLGLFKFHLVVPFVLLLLAQGRKKVLYGFCTVAAILTVVSFVLVGHDAFMSYPNYIFHLENSTGGGAISPQEMPNLRGVLDTILGPGPHLLSIVVALSLTAVFLSAWLIRGTEVLDLFDMDFSLSVFVTVLVSYHAQGYDLSILMLPTLLLMNEYFGEKMPSRLVWLVTLASAGLFFSPLPLLLLMHYGYLALMGLAVLVCACGIARQISVRARHHSSLMA